ncbi:MAG: hypothetical protein WAX14_10685 [Rhodococcus sp. (in: high G+C Gram-positive bacteria)]|uniref:hypothetical protein n=1 Tax=Rhodococcus sp. TaxID=1831 RepID=UPI003BB757CC
MESRRIIGVVGHSRSDSSTVAGVGLRRCGVATGDLGARRRSLAGMPGQQCECAYRCNASGAESEEPVRNLTDRVGRAACGQRGESAGERTHLGPVHVSIPVFDEAVAQAVAFGDEIGPIAIGATLFQPVGDVVVSCRRAPQYYLPDDSPPGTGEFVVVERPGADRSRDKGVHLPVDDRLGEMMHGARGVQRFLVEGAAFGANVSLRDENSVRLKRRERALLFSGSGVERVGRILQDPADIRGFEGDGQAPARQLDLQVLRRIPRATGAACSPRTYPHRTVPAAPSLSVCGR